ncbi:MAG: adenylosuccinate synthase [Bacilli bacterium]|nr:adenylosuccinate synthase [Bacilli bacterium]MCH4210267.1 adenylosuccinate synthase [Bacilli bacterium]MCH4228201.1 adenylosuccinate synthase [Bacilli bacterium]MCH4277445.1 adenylosuccinate synthase [Bacilli bacterium]MCI2054653.1 adenylosuccinate synthase [Bacilli bacterium]
MPSLAIQGSQWGDEGKGKITDFYASKADVVVRSQGGNNAGHSIVHHEKRYALRLLPSGVFNKNVTNILADGVVINPWALLDEIKGIKEAGVNDFKLLISEKATILMPYHIDLDKARENCLGKEKIGTTGKGIGPAYEDRAERTALRMGDLLERDYLKKRLYSVLKIKNIELAAYGAKTYDPEELYKSLLELAEELKGHIVDTSLFLSEAIKSKKKILFEGAQGAMLDLSDGTYPYVTSSSPLANAIPSNCGLPLDAVDNVLGIVKAYTTRVGEGPFPSEIEDLSLASAIREKGHEYGTVTHRPRRIGWLDAVELNYVRRVSGMSYGALMLLDVLTGLEEIKVVDAYYLDGKKIESMPSNVETLLRVKPHYAIFKSWKEDISGVSKYDDLPKEAKDYIAGIERLSGVKMTMISVGPDKDSTILLKELL